MQPILVDYFQAGLKNCLGLLGARQHRYEQRGPRQCPSKLSQEANRSKIFHRPSCRVPFRPGPTLEDRVKVRQHRVGRLDHDGSCAIAVRGMGFKGSTHHAITCGCRTAVRDICGAMPFQKAYVRKCAANDEIYLEK